MREVNSEGQYPENYILSNKVEFHMLMECNYLSENFLNTYMLPLFIWDSEEKDTRSMNDLLQA